MKGVVYRWVRYGKYGFLHDLKESVYINNKQLPSGMWELTPGTVLTFEKCYDDQDRPYATGINIIELPKKQKGSVNNAI